jgi:hypothetical protein
MEVRSIVAAWVGALLLGGCHGSLVDPAPPEPAVASLGEGAAPGGVDGPGGFVPRGEARNFYAGAGGRLWYYLNNYYWAPGTAPEGDLWIKAEVVAGFQGLRRWPDGARAPDPEPKVTVEYWRVGPRGRSVRLDNHKDYCLVSDGWSAGAVEVKVTLTLGRVRVADGRGVWETPSEAYVLERRNYTDDHGIGAERTRFVPLESEPVTEWGYRIPWSTHPERLTRSRWLDLELPTWSLLAKRAPPRDSRAPVTTPGEPAER